MAAPAPLSAYLAIPILAALGVGVVFGALFTVRVITRWLNRIKVPASKSTTYECGEEPVGVAWFRLNPRFITVALLFLVFDVELALLWPVLVRVLAWIGMGEGIGALVKIGAFIGTLFLALAYAWAKGDLDWNRRLTASAIKPEVKP